MANPIGYSLACKYRLHCVWLDFTLRPIVIWVVALLYYSAGVLARPLSPTASLFLFSQGRQVITRAWGLGGAVRWLTRRMDWALSAACDRPGFGVSKIVTLRDGAWAAAREAGIVLKRPRLQDGEAVEKGVLLLKYTHSIAAFHQCVDMEALLREYRLVLEPSWSGYGSSEFLSFTRYRNHTITILSPFQGDREFLDAIGSNLKPIELGAGDWVDPRLFRPLEGEQKRFDVAMIARWSHIKRHDLLLEAVRRIGDPAFRVALIASHLQQDSDRQGILSAIEASGLRRQVEIFEDIEPGEVNLVLNQSKVNVLLSRQEGANRGLFEGFFAGVPGLAFRNHIGIRIEHFQPETGRLIARKDLARELLYFRSNWNKFDPRSWALRNITPEISSRRLNEFLKGDALNHRERWTEDIVMKSNRPNVHYYPGDSDGENMPTMGDLLRRFATSVTRSS